VKGEILELKNTINTMGTNRSFASEVTRVLAKSARKEKLAPSEVKGWPARGKT